MKTPIRQKEGGGGWGYYLKLNGGPGVLGTVIWEPERILGFPKQGESTLYPETNRMDNVLSLDEAMAKGFKPEYTRDVRIGTTIWTGMVTRLEVEDGELKFKVDRFVFTLQSQAEVERCREWLELGAAVVAGK